MPPAGVASRNESGFHAMISPSARLGHPAMDKALNMLGSRYVWGGTSERDGMDCSGFVLRSYQDATGVKLPRTAAEMARHLKGVMPHELRPGDLVFFNTRKKPFSHVGIYLGGSMFAHAPKPGAPSRIDSLESHYWISAFDGARRPTSRTPRGPASEGFALLLENPLGSAKPNSTASRRTERSPGKRHARTAGNSVDTLVASTARP